MPLLDKLLARNLACSRKEARRLLDHAALGLPREISPDLLPLRIRVDGRSLELHDSFHLVLNKPAACVTALSDPIHDTAAVYVGLSAAWISTRLACSCGQPTAHGYTSSRTPAPRSRAPTTRRWSAPSSRSPCIWFCATGTGPASSTCAPCSQTTSTRA